MSNSLLDQHREFLKDTIRQKIDFSQTDQSRRVAPPPLEKPFSADATRIRLVAPDQWQGIGQTDLASAMRNRQSRREFTDKPLRLAELSFLLWATQGIRQRLNKATALRMVPSAGARHALETYPCIFNVEGLKPAIYRYLPLEHELLLEFHVPDARQKLVEAALGQSFVAEAAATFIWTAVPYRMEWRYGLAAHKVIALDAGHVCQNLYLACEAIGAGTCAVGAYHQQLMNRLVRVDGTDEFVIYLAPVGKL
ncbi:MAG: SagB/ThcOx family dehydrogenase [Planctomycetes bacterium]|nr:SagB/ThcOx family dehydrogenase [Planctomycetota bacterium]MBU4399025.1 SagB/ThcOx family dehydrogenase [Planctomycetota bacterium]MCG2685505.1 SagB/ThcOx family dehydrogenase [Planctomycetales bacterium]